MGNSNSLATQTVLRQVSDSSLEPVNVPLHWRSTDHLDRMNCSSPSDRPRKGRRLSLSVASNNFTGAATAVPSKKCKTDSRKRCKRETMVTTGRKRTDSGSSTGSTTACGIGTAEQKAELFAAVIRGDEETVLRLLDDGRGLDVNTTDGNHLTPLHYAAMHARPNLVDLLIQHGANVDAYDMKGGFTPLHWVVINSHPGMSEEGRVDECLLALVRGGCNVNSKDFNQATPLHFAARTDNRAVVDALMRLGADPNEVDVLGRSCAAVAKSPETKILIISLADLRQRAIYQVLEIPGTL